jgi:hypothetical protein
MNNVENYDQYKAATNASNWAGIFALNGSAIDSFATKKELNVLADYLEPEEVVLALASGVMQQSGTSNSFDVGLNSWLAVATDRRLLFIDHAMLTNAVDTQVIRLDRVQAVSSSQGFVLGKISIDLGARVLVIDNCMKEHVKIWADMANKAISEREDAQSAPVAPVVSEDPIAKLKELGALKEAGILTEEEFNTTKTALLAKLAA